MTILIRAMLFGVLVAALSSTGLSEQRLKEIVAKVDDQEILYEEIAVDSRDLELFLRQRGSSIDQLTEEQADQTWTELEQQALASRIRAIVSDQAIRRFGIEVSDEEVIQRRKEIYAGFDLDEAFSKIREGAERLSQALIAVYEHGEDPERVYQESMSEQLTELEWENLLHEYRTKQKREELNPSTAGEPSVNRGVKMILVAEKLRDHIDQQIAEMDPRFEHFKRLIEAHQSELPILEVDPTNSLHMQLKEAFTYVELTRECWWQERYQDAAISISYERLSEALDFLFREQECSNLGKE